VARPELDPLTLFRLGRAGIADLVLIPLDGLSRELRHAVARSTRISTASMVMRMIRGRLPATERHVLFSALDGAPLGWRADDLAHRAGWTRAHLSVRLKHRGMPSAGHLLTWAKLLHAGRWLDAPGRTAESVSRQLEYSSGAAFRRILHNYVGGTPTSLRTGGAWKSVLARFLDVCGLGDSVGADRSVA
jgi:AraC-like DNA-binding protein